MPIPQAMSPEDLLQARRVEVVWDRAPDVKILFLKIPRSRTGLVLRDKLGADHILRDVDRGFLSVWTGLLKAGWDLNDALRRAKAQPGTPTQAKRAIETR
jgi:hypothetical protein